MKSVAIGIYLILTTLRLLPHIILYSTSPSRQIIEKDLERYSGKEPSSYTFTSRYKDFVRVMTKCPSFRNIFYYRIKKEHELLTYIIKYLCHPVNTLCINTPYIGPGLYILHGFGTIIAAESIGNNCWIFQQVTIGGGWHGDHRPIIGDNVIIYPGAKVIGTITIGNNSLVGANAVVLKDVPANCTVVGVPAYIVTKDGLQTRESLENDDRTPKKRSRG